MSGIISKSVRSSGSISKAPRLVSLFSSSSARPAPPQQQFSSPARAGETVEDTWKRNVDQIRESRRRQATRRSKVSLFIPPTSTPPPVRPAPPSATQTSLSTLLASGAALGHSTSSLSPAFMPYVYGNRSGLSIIDLDQTLPLLRRAANLVRDVVLNDGVVMIVGTRDGHKKMMNKTRERLGDNGYVVGEWLAGTLTNSATFFGIEPTQNKSHLPHLAIFLNPSENLGAIRECTAKNIPTVGIVDSNVDPRIVTYPIPANMESLRTAELVLGTLSLAGQEGRARREERRLRGRR